MRFMRTLPARAGAAPVTEDVPVERTHGGWRRLRPSGSGFFLVAELGAPDDRRRQEERSRCHHGIGSDARPVADQGAELLTARRMQVRADANQDVVGGALVAVVADDASCFEVPSSPSTESPTKVKWASFVPPKTNDDLSSAPGPRMHLSATQLPPRTYAPAATKQPAPTISGPFKTAPSSMTAPRCTASSSEMSNSSVGSVASSSLTMADDFPTRCHGSRCPHGARAEPANEPA